MPLWLETFLLAFIPLLVALDPLGLIPIYLSLADGVPLSGRGRVVAQAVGTAALLAVGFIFLGKLIFHTLGIGMSDFKIAGGLILLGLAAQEILLPKPREDSAPTDFGVVPLGMPLIAGPAMLTTLLALIDSVGLVRTLVSLGINLTLVYLALTFSEQIKRLVGATALRAVSKMVALLLAAIAVSMIRTGLAS
jgi:multiple antibiotic resistance protein